MPKRKVIARGYFNRRVWEPGEEVDVPATFKASWLEGEPEAPKRRRKKAEPAPSAEPEVTEETVESDDDAS